jgi:hypothetical protein
MYNVAMVLVLLLKRLSAGTPTIALKVVDDGLQMSPEHVEVW